MKKTITFLLAALIALPAQAQTQTQTSAPESNKPTPVTLTDAETAAIKKEIANHLKDPESAQFSGIKAVDAMKEHPQMFIVACGFVNAKNSYGGYVGKTLFSVYLANGKPGGAQISDGPGLVELCMIKYGIALSAE